MIGNIIEFLQFDERDLKKEPVKCVGLVVDAFTEVTGNVSGKSETFLGFGDGHISGTTNSNRIYKIQTYSDWDNKKEFPTFIDIRPYQLRKIISFAGSRTQEDNEEKVIVKE